MTSLPKLSGPPRPGWKMQDLQNAVGKTISAVEYGEVESHPDVHEAETIVFHFSDGSSMAIIVGSNAKNLSHDYAGLKPEDFHTDLRPIWAPAISRVTNSTDAATPDTDEETT